MEKDNMRDKIASEKTSDSATVSSGFTRRSMLGAAAVAVPFFAHFLSRQAYAAGDEGTPETQKYPSDNDGDEQKKKTKKPPEQPKPKQ